MLKDIFQWALIVVFAGLSVFFYSQKHNAGGQSPVGQPTDDGGRDGNPIGFDLKTINQVLLYVTGEATSSSCFSSGASQKPCYVQIRYLSVTYPPSCVTGATYDCTPNQKLRQLPYCPNTSGTVCVTVKANAYAQHQDKDGVHPPISQAVGDSTQTMIIFSPALIPNT